MVFAPSTKAQNREIIPCLALRWVLAQHGHLLASGAFDGQIRLWNMRKTLPATCVQILSGHTNWVTSLAFAPDGRTLASASWDQTVKLWEMTNGSLLQTLSGHTDRAFRVAWSPDGRTVANCGDDGAITLWDLNCAEHLRTLRRDRPHERLNITGIRGLTEAQKATLRALGAIEEITIPLKRGESTHMFPFLQVRLLPKRNEQLTGKPTRGPVWKCNREKRRRRPLRRWMPTSDTWGHRPVLR
jgi:WD domain, G-beta repeat